MQNEPKSRTKNEVRRWPSPGDRGGDPAMDGKGHLGEGKGAGERAGEGRGEENLAPAGE